MKLIDKSALVAEIENLLDKSKYYDDYESAFRDGNNAALYALKARIDTLEVKEVDLEKEIDSIWNSRFNLGWDDKSLLSINHEGFANIAKHFFELGLKAQKENLWRSADGDDLPDVDREVIALVWENQHYKVVFAHRPPRHWDGTNILTNETTRYYPKTYGKGGWNIPNVKFWLDCELPKVEE